MASLTAADPLLSLQTPLSTLEALQLSDPAQIPRTLHKLLPLLPPPSLPPLLPPILDLLQIHPQQTLPFIPDLITPHPETISQVLETLASLLQSDRTLLLPILATLADIPLNAPQKCQVRQTLVYALDIADENDLPALIRAVCRAGSTWAIDKLRNVCVPQDIMPVVCDVVKSCIGARADLMKCLWRRVSWIDMYLACVTLQQHSSALYISAIRHGITRAFASGEIRYLESACERLALVLEDVRHGLRRYAGMIVSAMDTRGADVAEILYCARFVYKLTCIVPAIANGMLGDLQRGGWVSRAVVACVARVVDVRCLQDVGGVMRARRCNVWNAVLINVRKRLLFGGYIEKRGAMSVCEDVVVGGGDIDGMVEVIDACVGPGLGDEVSVDVLSVLARGLVGDYVDVKRLQRRVEVLPKGLVSVSEGVVEVDVGLFWRQHPLSVAAVIPAAAATAIVKEGGPLAVGLLEVAVLVPVVCIGLYEAVGEYISDGSVSSNVKEMSREDIVSSVISFRAGMASLIGLMNLACFGGIELCEKALDERGHEKGDSGTSTLWALLERVSELDRMLHSMFLAQEALRELGADNKSGKGRKRRPGEGDDLERVERLTRCVSGRLCGWKGRKIDEGDEEFPVLSLESVVCGLVAVPDEAGIQSIWDAQVFEGVRDFELVRIDRLLLSRLVRLMKNGWAVEKNVSKKRIDFVDSGPDGDEAVEILKMEETFPELDKRLEETDNIFAIDGIGNDCDEATEEPEEDYSELWAVDKAVSRSDEKAYMTSAVAQMASPSLGKKHIANIIHSPRFAALLLDRAATYVAVSRNSRAADADLGFMRDVTNISGMALMCLVGVLRCAPMFRGNGELQQSEEMSSAKRKSTALHFLKRMGERLEVRIRRPQTPDQRPPGTVDITRAVWQVLDTLKWIAETSVEAAVAAMAVEAILTVCELQACPKHFGRQVALTSLMTVYEYDATALWDEDDRSMLFLDPYDEWSVRQRTPREFGEPLSGACDSDLSDSAPWVDFRGRPGRKSKSLERHRLALYFSGMFMPDALLEGCGWVRELSQAFCRPEGHVRVTKNSRKKKSARVKETHREDPSLSVTSKQFDTCDKLLDMLGLRSIMETLLHVVQTALQTFVVSESLTVEQTSSDWTNPIPHLGSASRLLSGLLHLYAGNRQALVSASKDAKNVSTVSADLDLDHSIVLSCITALQQYRYRIEEVLTWYTNPVTEVSQLSQEAATWMEEFVGLTAQAVGHCAELAESIKTEQFVAIEDVENPDSQPKTKATRRAPGYDKRRKMSAQKKAEEVSKAGKLIPRLTSQCESLIKSLQKLARAMGIRARRSLVSLAPPPVSQDEAVHFGVGLRNPDEDDMDAAKADENAEELAANHPTTNRNSTADEEESESDSEPDGFHTRTNAGRSACNPATNTVTVNFKQ